MQTQRTSQQTWPITLHENDALDFDIVVNGPGTLIFIMKHVNFEAIQSWIAFWSLVLTITLQGLKETSM